MDVSLIVEQMCKNFSPTKTRRGNCLVLPHTGYVLHFYIKSSKSKIFSG